MSQIVDRFEAATHTLLGDGPVKNRLGSAYSAYLEDLEQVELPIPGMSEFSELHAAMHSAGPVGRLSPVAASIQKMSAAEAAAHARTILRLYTELLAMEQGARPAVEAGIEDAEERLPRFLAGGRR
jgi:hypothetical protein